MKQLYLGIILFFSCAFVHAQSHFSRGNGDWDIPGQWSTTAINGPSCGCTPGAGADVLIDGHNIDIDAGTGSITVNSIKLTNATNSAISDLTVEGGVTLTITTDLELELAISADDCFFTVRDAGTRVNIGDDWIYDQNSGDDIITDINDDAIVSVTDEFLFDQDGGDDCRLFLYDDAQVLVGDDIRCDQDGGNDIEVEINDDALIDITDDLRIDQDGGDDIQFEVNSGSGTSADLVIDDDLVVDKDGGNDVRFDTYGSASTITVGGFADIDHDSDNTDDDTRFRVYDGLIDITGDIDYDCPGTGGQLQIELGVGQVGSTAEFDCDDIFVDCTGPLFTDAGLRILIDNNGDFDCASIDAFYDGGDDFFLKLDDGSTTTSSSFTCTGNFDLDCDAHDDIEIELKGVASDVNIGGNMVITHIGPDSEEIWIELEQSSTFDVTGDLTITTADGENVAGNEYRITLTGTPAFTVGDDFSWTTSRDADDTDFEILGGTFTVVDDMAFNQVAGGNDLDIYLQNDADVDVGGDFSLSNNGADDVSIYMGTSGASTAIWNVDGNATLLQSNPVAGAAFRQRIYNGAQFRVGGVLTQQVDDASSDLVLMDIQDASEVRVGGNTVLTAPGSGDLEIRLIDNAFYRIGGNFVRAAAPNNFGELDCTGNSTVEYNGSIAQIIAEDAGAGGDSFTYENLEITNTFGTNPQLTMEGVATVNGDLEMNDGVVLSDATDILVVADGGTTSNASDDSHVDGYMRKVGNDAFTFPIGDNGFYGPLGINAFGAATDQFEAQYIEVMPHTAGFDSSLHDATVLYISKVEYWRLNQTAGTSDRTVTLSWDTPRSGGVGVIADLRFMRWNGATWNDLGQTGATGTTAAGTIDNNTAITAYADGNPFTFGTTNTLNPLPIELVSFDATMRTDHVDLEWITASELNNEKFTIEKSADGQDWEYVCEQAGAINSSTTIYYDDLDPNPFNGISYYRLKQTDLDGSYEYSDAVQVSRDIDFTIYPNPSDGDVYIQADELPDFIEVYNALGQIVPVEFNEVNGRIHFSTSEMVSGTYMVKFATGNYQGTQRLVVQH